MHIGIILETDQPEKVWNVFRFGVAALESGHTVEAFLLGAGVEAPDIEHEDLNAHGMMVKFTNQGGVLYGCGTCIDYHDLEETDLRPYSKMSDLVSLVEKSDRLITVG